MADAYTLTVRVEAHEYEGEFYLVGEGYGTARDVLKHVAAEHITRVERTRHIEQYLLEVLNTGETVPEAEYEAVDSAVDCGLHIDVPYQRFAFWVGDHIVEIEGQPTESQINSLAGDLPS